LFGIGFTFGVAFGLILLWVFYRAGLAILRPLRRYAAFCMDTWQRSLMMRVAWGVLASLVLTALLWKWFTPNP
jgi:hypothetical protein